LICFGLSEHTVEERQTLWTPQVKKELAILASWFPKRKMEEVVRPAYKSDVNFTETAMLVNIRTAVALFVLRELPIKSFYTRAFIGYLYIEYVIGRGIRRGFFKNRPIVYYNNDMHLKSLMNYPDLFWWNLCRVVPKNPPIRDPHIEWRLLQQPTFHQYHKNVYRYRFRKPRFIQWDGSMNQPVMPFMLDHGTDVPNGTFRRNTNGDPQTR
jgi:hypothetical protein